MISEKSLKRRRENISLERGHSPREQLDRNLCPDGKTVASKGGRKEKGRIEVKSK